MADEETKPDWLRSKFVSNIQELLVASVFGLSWLWLGSRLFDWLVSQLK